MFHHSCLSCGKVEKHAYGHYTYGDHTEGHYIFGDHTEGHYIFGDHTEGHYMYGRVPVISLA